MVRFERLMQEGQKALDATSEFLANIGPAARKNFKKGLNWAGNAASGVGRWTSKWAKRAESSW